MMRRTCSHPAKKAFHSERLWIGSSQAKPAGLLESDPHPPGTVEHLYLLKGEVEITVGDEVRTAKAGEAIRYRADMPHKIRNTGDGEAHA